MVLAGAEVILLFGKGRPVGLLARAEGLTDRFVLTQVVVEGAFSVACLVHGPEAAVVLGNVGVAAASVVAVDHWLGVDVGLVR